MEEFSMPQKVTICLNMIVKNESHIIENTLEKLCNKIKFDYWVICDTGSTDNTPEIITDFFSKKDIKGELYYDAWENFAHNRTLALKRAYKKTDLLLVFDADDEIVGDIKIPEDVLFDEYSLQFGSSSGTSYTRVLMINNHKIFEYASVIHEIIYCKEGPTKGMLIEGDYYVVSGRTGSRSFDQDKYLKDALVLEKAYAEAVTKKDPLFNRYAFYCANSYKDCGKFEDAIKWYKITLNHEHQWGQEKYISCLYIYECFEKLEQKETGFFYLVKAFAYDNERLECLYPLLVHYCCENMHKVAYNYYLNIKDFFENKYLNTNISAKLFSTLDKFNFFVPYYMILIADKVQDFYCVVKMYEIIFTKKQRMFEEWYIKNLLYNLQFFLQHVPKDNTQFIPLANEYFKFVYENGIELQKFDFLSKPEYKNAGIIMDNYIIKEVTNKSQHFSKNECANSKNILIYTGFSDIDWNFTYMQNNALGGSEKAVAYLSKCFPTDYNIFISGHVKNETIDNIQYIHLNELTNLIERTPFHTVIVSRYIGFYEMFETCSFYQSFIWAHDTLLLPYGCNLNETHILKKWNNYIDGCVCLTEWHKTIFSEKYPELKNKITLINNGLELTSFPNIDSNNILKNNKIKNKFIYTSRPDRGLNILLKLWPQIIEKVPDATLTISTYGSFPSNAEEFAMKTLIDATPSIHYLGKLNVEQLYNEMSTAEFWLYPTNWPETSCITALEMLMSEVICLYYPVAGLVNTVGDYGIQIKPGSEIDAIVSLTDFKKCELRQNGREYAETCSWENRFSKWTELLELNIINKYRIPEERIKINKLGIFNGFPFHYEMFGFVLNYAQNNNYEVDIFTNKTNTLGWFEFYREKFNNFNINDISKFNGDTSEYATFFVTTDDDSKFKSEWISDNVVCVNHYYRIRTSNFKHYLNIANFKDSTLDYVYPCYPSINYRDKIQNNNVCIIGGGNIHHNHNINLINRLQSNGRIKLNIFVRKECKTNISGLEMNKFDINFIEDITTSKMIQLLNQSSYVLLNYNDNEDHNNGISCSGSLQLALSTLCKPIIFNTTNKYLQIKNALEYDIKSNEPILIDKEINFQLLEQERNNYVDKFDNYIKNILSPLKVKNNFEHDEVNISLLDNIKEYKPIYQHFLDRSNAEIMFRKLIYNIMPYFKDKNIIDLGAYIGDNSIPWAMNSTGIIYAIDPSKENTVFIDKMAKHNRLGNVITITKAISDKCEIIYYNEVDPTHISCNTDNGKNSFEAVSLDSLNLENIGFIHLDVEGFEYKVLNGSINIITKYNPIIAWENHIEREDYMKVVNFLSYHKYTTYMINEQFPHCFPDCRNFISFPENCNISVNELNNKFKEVYTEFTPDKNNPLLILKHERNNYVNKFDKYIGNIFSTVYLRILSDYWTSNNMEDWMQTDKLSYMYNKPVILTKKDDFTHCIIINSGMPHLNIDKSKVVGISHEPTLPEEPLFSQLIEYSKNNMSKYFIGDKNNLPEPFIEGETFMFHNTTRYNNIAKTKFCSIVISGKQFTMGHKYRHKLVEAILKTDLPIDIYGYGVEIYKQKMDDTRLKYPLENTLKNPCGTDPFIDYKFHICIENMVSNNYFSEKIINPLLSNVIPIYYGCKKIDEYFDNIVKLSGNEEDDIQRLKNIYQNQNIYDNNIDSDKILDKCNMFYNLHTFFDDIKLKDEIIIPKKIFQTWETHDIEEEFQQIINKWKVNNPNYEYIFHDAEQRLQFIQDNFKENVLNAYKKIIPGAYKCDLWRYCVLFIYGGFYADIDTLCMGKLNSLTNENIEFIVPIDLNINPTEGKHNLACGFIGSVPKSPILLDAIDRIVFNVENNIIPASKLDFSGPGVLGRAVNKFLNLDETSSFKGKEGIKNNINFLEFDPNTEYMKDVFTDTFILQNKNKNSDIIRLYNNECNKIKNYTCWLSNNIIKMV
jgi:FkbM family methyltransferase